MPNPRTKITVVDERKAWSWAWRNYRSQMMIYILYVAQEAVRNDGLTEIEGFNITEEKVI